MDLESTACIKGHFICAPWYEQSVLDKCLSCQFQCHQPHILIAGGILSVLPCCILQAQANYAEYQPYFIFLTFLLEVNNLLSTNLLHAFCATWTVLRLLHFFQLWGWIGPLQFRKYPWQGSVALLLLGSGLAVYYGITDIMSGSSSVREAAYSRIMDYADAAKKEL